MKNKKSKLSILVAAALLGVSFSASAEDQGAETFIPLERLTPQQRNSLQSQIEDLILRGDIDWERFVPGVNEKGELILRERNEIPSSPIAQPSCWEAT